MTITDLIYITLLIIAIGFIIGLNIVNVVDNRLGSISINIPKINCSCDKPTETFTNYVVPTNKPEIIASQGDAIQVTNNPEVIKNRPESSKTFQEQQNQEQQEQKQEINNEPQNMQTLFFTPTAEQYYRSEYYYPFIPEAQNQLWLPYNSNYYEDRGNSEDRVLQNPNLNHISSYEYLIQDAQY